MKTDKNLGPAVMQVSQYKALAYSDHLFHHQTYWQLTPTQAQLRTKTIHNILKHFICCYFPTHDKAQDNDRKYLNQTLTAALQKAEKRNLLPISHFYLLAKIHKMPLSTHPIVSVSGSLLYGLGKGVNFKLQEIIRLFPD